VTVCQTSSIWHLFFSCLHIFLWENQSSVTFDLRGVLVLTASAALLSRCPDSSGYDKYGYDKYGER
jgi:hypothetical protein